MSVEAPTAPSGELPPLPPSLSRTPNPYLPQTPPMMPLPTPMQQQQQTQPSWWQGVDATFPPISQMLMREAEAWRALLQLHGSVLNLSRAVTNVTTSEVKNPTMWFDEPQEASEQRESAYIASISQLCAQCDLLVSEAVKIRGLRRAKYQAESVALREIVRTHADEAMGVGEILARNSSMQTASVTSELRQAAQAMRSQVQQARALLAATLEWKGVVPEGAPHDLEFVMGWRSGERVDIRPVAQVLEHVYQRGQLTDENLTKALLEGPFAEKEPTVQLRTFSRRSVDSPTR